MSALRRLWQWFLAWQVGAVARLTYYRLRWRGVPAEHAHRIVQEALDLYFVHGRDHSRRARSSQETKRP